MRTVGRVCPPLAAAAAGLISLGADAAIVPIDRNHFFADPGVTIAPDWGSAQFEESELATFVRLVNDPFLGDPEAVVAAAGTVLTFDFEFIEASDGDDSISAVLLDADTGAFAGELERFEVTDSQPGTVRFVCRPMWG